MRCTIRHAASAHARILTKVLFPPKIDKHRRGSTEQHLRWCVQKPLMLASYSPHWCQSSRIEILNDGGYRSDGRLPSELRSLTFDLSPQAGADGSATVSHGLTQVLVSVFGPREAKSRAQTMHDRAALNVEVAVAPFSTGDRRKRGRGDKRILELAATIKSTFEPVVQTTLYPRSQIDIFVHVLQQDGGVLQAAVNATEIGKAYTALLNQGVPGILGHMVGGGKVAENANVSNAVTPKWRTAKSHVILSQGWNDTAMTPADVMQLRRNLTTLSTPLLDAVTGESDAGSYSSEGDVLEPKFQTTFFGPNYPRLTKVKATYDPHDLFIVGAGVGSERWDADGLCRK
ncbi:hypothetical protein EWM64_g2610 [Hericium alpestre]|uniref:Berberine/berberine-like domain-containing protein n=1 Tax=Hericium alpestre TaxID=135208 RepID=A0A4Z0A505_9AGAM|nr:hypothetical protein EWM64_g2610 [Hericium alpestre]